MSGTKAGGLKAALTNLERYGEDFYTKIGHKGGIAQVPKGFSMDRRLAQAAGRKGGKTSKRGKAVVKEVEEDEIL